MAGKTSDGLEAGASGGKSCRAHWAVLGTVCALIIVFFAWNAESGMKELWDSQPADSYYNLLVQGFRAGQLNVKREAPPGLAQLADPQDLEAASPYLLIPGSQIFDMSYYKGKLYLYFGITPALLLFWPYAALTGHYLLHKEAVVIFSSVGFLAGVWLLWTLWRRYFAEVGFGVVVAGALALGLGTGIPYFLVDCDFYEVVVSCGFALTMLALVAIWKALHETERRGWWLAAGSLAYGLAVGARPNLLCGAVILLLPVVVAWREGRRVWPVLMAEVVPIGIIGMGLMLYNFLRFGNPMEFGWRYQIPAIHQHAQPFSLRYLWFNFRLYFLDPARWSGRYPFIRDIVTPPLPTGYEGVETHFGVLSNIPVVWLALAAPLAWRGRTVEARSILRRFLAAVALLFGICVLTLCLYCFVTFRYEMDFLPALGLLAVIGIFGLERALAGRRGWRNVVRCGWGPLLTISVAFNLFASYDRHANFHDNFGAALLQKGQVDDAIAQFQKALEISPNFWEANNILGGALLQKGRVDEGIAYLQKALEINPDSTVTHNNLGIALLEKGQVDEGIAHFQKALEISPDNVDANSALGSALCQKGQVDEGIAHFRKALGISPNDGEANNGLGIALLDKGQMDEGIAHFQKALGISPNDAAYHYNLGCALVRKGRVHDAITCLQKGLELEPNNPNFQNDLAWLLATCPDASIRNGPKAVQLAQQADRLSKGEDPLILRTLAAAYAENGQFPEAVASARRALHLATARNNAALVNELGVQLGFYQAGSPFRDASLANTPSPSTQNTLR